MCVVGQHTTKRVTCWVAHTLGVYVYMCVARQLVKQSLLRCMCIPVFVCWLCCCFSPCCFVVWFSVVCLFVLCGVLVFVFCV